MSCKIKFSACQDDTIRDMRAAGFSWDAIAIACKISHRQQIIERARVIGVRSPVRQDLVDDEADRDPLPPGSPASWMAINASLTSIAIGTPYPAYRVR